MSFAGSSTQIVHAAEGENLPSTSGSLDLHIRRTHYTAMVQVTSLLFDV